MWYISGSRGLRARTESTCPDQVGQSGPVQHIRHRVTDLAHVMMILVPHDSMSPALLRTDDRCSLRWQQGSGAEDPPSLRIRDPTLLMVEGGRL